MRDAPVQPGERGALERPADRDPLLLQLQRNRDGDERERGAGDERQAAEVALPAGSRLRSERSMTASTAPSTTGMTPIIQSS